MNSNDNLKLELLKEEDIETLTPMMKRAFDRDSQIHLNEAEGGPDGYDNGEFLRKYGLDENSTSFKVLLNDKIVGAVIVWINKETNENYLGCIFLDSNIQNSGVGQGTWKEIEKKFPDTKVWRVETPGFSRRNHYFYVNKCGFKIVHIENQKDLHECMYFMEKIMK